MKVSTVTAPGTTELLDVDQPQPGPADILVRMRACGICGSDALYISIGGVPPRQGCTPLGHEPAGEVAHVGAEVNGVSIGDHVVINPMAAPSGIIGNGGATGALADYLLIENAVRGLSFEVIPDHIPWEVAALNEPMAVARHGANRCNPKPGDKVVVFGPAPSAWAPPWRSSRSVPAMWWSSTSLPAGWTRRCRSAPTPSSTRPRRTSSNG